MPMLMPRFWIRRALAAFTGLLISVDIPRRTVLNNTARVEQQVVKCGRCPQGATTVIPAGFLILVRALPWIALCSVVAAVAALSLEVAWSAWRA